MIIELDQRMIICKKNIEFSNYLNNLFRNANHEKKLPNPSVVFPVELSGVISFLVSRIFKQIALIILVKKLKNLNIFFPDYHPLV